MSDVPYVCKYCNGTKPVHGDCTELNAVRAGRDSLQEEVLVLRNVVPAQLHGDRQYKANAYAALRAFDARKAGARR